MLSHLDLRPPLIVLAICVPILLVLLGLNGWREMNEWSHGSRALGFVALIAPIIALVSAQTTAAHRDQAEREERARCFDSTLEPPDFGVFSSIILPALPGGVLGGALALVILYDSRIGPLIGLPALLILPKLGMGLGAYFSPGMRTRREYERRVEAELSRREAKDQQQRAVEADRRLREAVHWWRVYGRRLFPSPASTAFDPRHLEEYVRVHARALLRRKVEILRGRPAATHSPDELAVWAIRERAEFLAEQLPESEARRVQGVEYILRLYEKHEALLLPEAEAVLYEKAIRETPPLNEDIEDSFRRMIDAYESILEFLRDAKCRTEATVRQLDDEKERKRRYQEIMQVAEKLAANKMRRLAGL